MILPFSTQLNGKPTHFVERIHIGLIEHNLWAGGFDAIFAHRGYSMNALNEKNAKIHTIRKDKKDRWKPGTKIDFFINCRQKDMFRFAPVLPVVSIQEIEIIWYSRLRLIDASKLVPERYNYLEVLIDGRILTITEIEKLAQNDGFDSVEEFFEYFKENFKGKIIHWTNFKY